MSAIVVNEGKNLVLETVVAEVLEGCFLRLFQNDYTPIPGSELADFTELTGASDGYAEKTLTSWGAPVLGADDFYTAALPVEVFTNSGLLDWEECFGWYYVDPGGTVCLAAARFTSSVTLGAGLSLPIVPQFGQGSEF